MEEISIRSFKKKELNQVEKPFYTFLVERDEEKETLFPEKYTEEIYPKVCRNIINATFFLVVAFRRNNIVGVSGLRRTRKGFLGGIWPVIRGYSIVDKSYQGRGIGSRLFREKERYMKKLFAYHLSEVVRGNVAMESIFKKSMFRVVHRDEVFTYYYKPLRGLMAFFAPLFEHVYRYMIKNAHMSLKKKRSLFSASLSTILS
ncbi:MAG: GNAT family N-acetyltransferase [Candidatus Aenigmarchaeota archaeon]|nr:GNAT family N-acetyltransferase [Candidatus Aenigmarchaeota archaeon]